MQRSSLALWALAAFLYLASVSSFTRSFQRPTRSLQVAAAKKAELSGPNLWRITLSLRRAGCKNIEAVARVRFVADGQYEPPQGRLFIEDDLNGLIKCNERGYAGGWTLSEDKNDRKDGLWIWGLFEEPKYPFLYFFLDVYDTVVLPSGEEDKIFDGEGIPNARLKFRFNHVRDKERGSLLSDGQMTYKLTEMVKADPLGIGGTIDVGDEISAGICDITLVEN
ncbi:hypothetical protein B484DRAFT_443708 [Ochromonadaceae sp. CCMP2298]|nr:hypothetical protein B484DRAFT_443708 [Ochromonadaceae sp. CCMP2298]